MPSPVGHSLMGYIIYRAAVRPVEELQWTQLVLSILAANAADLDFIPGFFVGDPNRYHHGISHSIGFAGLFALVPCVVITLPVEPEMVDQIWQLAWQWCKSTLWVWDDDSVPQNRT